MTDNEYIMAFELADLKAAHRRLHETHVAPMLWDAIDAIVLGEPHIAIRRINRVLTMLGVETKGEVAMVR